MNKGLRLVFCKECERKRYCIKESIPDSNFKWTCSKGHSWIIKGVTLERIVTTYQDIITPEKIRNIFERDNIFYTKLRNK